jgi:pimeloyl-ACP methyl ester carboxylesterase
MTVVLVHGNPETDAVWDPLVDALRRDDLIRLSPPGFGAPLPDGWPATTWITATGWRTSWRVWPARSTSSDTTGAALT